MIQKGNVKIAWEFLMILTFSIASIFASCTKGGSGDDDLIGNWVRSSDFDGNTRSEAVLFVINNKAYIATGSTDRDRFKDVWEYDIIDKFWTRRTDFPSVARNSAVAFTIGNKGYIATGFDGNNKLNDVWEYDPSVGTGGAWTQKNNFPGTARYDAVAFTIGNKGYISSGFDGNYLKDLWEYNAISDTWIQKASIGGSKRSAAAAFVLNGKAYVCSGTNNGSALNDLWQYDQATNSWTEKRKLTNVSDENYDDKYSSIVRSNGVSFVMDNLGYITTGENGSLNNDTWEYNPTSDAWAKRTSFEGSPRTGAIGFTLNGKGFVLTGRSGALSFDNAYQFFPTAKYNSND